MAKRQPHILAGSFFEIADRRLSTIYQCYRLVSSGTVLPFYSNHTRMNSVHEEVLARVQEQMPRAFYHQIAEQTLAEIVPESCLTINQILQELQTRPFDQHRLSGDTLELPTKIVRPLLPTIFPLRSQTKSISTHILLWDPLSSSSKQL